MQQYNLNATLSICQKNSLNCLNFTCMQKKKFALNIKCVYQPTIITSRINKGKKNFIGKYRTKILIV